MEAWLCKADLKAARATVWWTEPPEFVALVNAPLTVDETFIRLAFLGFSAAGFSAAGPALERRTWGQEYLTGSIPATLKFPCRIRAFRVVFG
jgi:hypothetical protein